MAADTLIVNGNSKLCREMMKISASKSSGGSYRVAAAALLI